MGAGRLAAFQLTLLLAAAGIFLALQHGTAAGWIAAGFAVPLVVFGGGYAFGVEHRIGFGILAAAALAALAAGALAGLAQAEPCVAVSPFSADRFEPSRISMRAGESRTLTVLDAHGYCRGNPAPGVFGSGGSFSSSDRNVATVSQRGVVTAHAPGSAIVSYGGARAEIKVSRGFLPGGRGRFAAAGGLAAIGFASAAAPYAVAARRPAAVLAALGIGAYLAAGCALAIEAVLF